MSVRNSLSEVTAVAGHLFTVLSPKYLSFLVFVFSKPALCHFQPLTPEWLPPPGFHGRHVAGLKCVVRYFPGTALGSE